MSTLKQKQSVSPIELVKSLVTHPQSTEQTLGALDGRYDPEIERLRAASKALDAPLEQSAREKVNERVSFLTREKQTKIAKLARVSVTESMFNTELAKLAKTIALLLPKYPFVEIDEIPWLCKKSCKPQIIPFDLSGPCFSVQRTNDAWGYSGVYWDRVSERKQAFCGGCLGTHFEPYIQTIFLGVNRATITEVYAFEGVIPSETKDAIRSAESDFSGDGGFLLMLADADTLTVTRQRTLRPPYSADRDPLIMGYHPDTPRLLWLIAAFDVTPVEQLIMGEALERFHKSKKT